MLCDPRTDLARRAKRLASFLALLFFFPLVCAQEQTTQTKQLIKVNVIVTDRGRSVEDIRKEDLQVIEDDGPANRLVLCQGRAARYLRLRDRRFRIGAPDINAPDRCRQDRGERSRLAR